MKKIYTLLLTGVVLASTVAAQHSALPHLRKSTEPIPSSGNSNSPDTNVGHFPARPVQNFVRNGSVLPADQQIHSPVRWYALEHAPESDYWKHVNTERIWLELDLNASPADPEISAFIADFNLGEPVKQSLHPQLTNFYVYERPGTISEEVIEMAQVARSTPGILFLEPSVIYKGNLIPNDPLWNQQWGPYTIYADVAWDGGFSGGGSDNIMAVVDDAIDWFHEDLYDQVWYGYDYGFNDADPVLDGSEQKHGTHVAGILGATSNNGVGMAGMCNDTVYFAKVTDNTYFTDNGAYSTAGIINAIYDIATINRVLVINLSLGGGAPSAAAEAAYNFAWNSGKLPIAASGNEGNSQISYPAGYEACMAVGSIGTDGQQIYLTGYSNYGLGQEVTAPGGDINTGYGIISTTPNNNYEAFEGTSMACPHVAGLAGLMKSINPGLSNADIRNIINATCFDLGETGYDVAYGYGMVNAQLAVQVALGQVGVAERESHELKIYPNPASDEVWIENFEGGHQGAIAIYNLSGQLIRSNPIPIAKLIPVDVSELPEGVYVVQLNDGDRLQTGRFVKTK